MEAAIGSYKSLNKRIILLLALALCSARRGSLDLLRNIVNRVQVRSKILVRELFSTANLRLVSDLVSNVINHIVERLSQSFV